TNLGRDAAPFGDLVAVFAGPLSDLRCIAAGAGAGATLCSTTGAPCQGCPLLQLGAQLLRVLVVQADLVGDAGKAERDGVVRVRAVDVVDEENLRLAGQRAHQSSVEERRQYMPPSRDGSRYFCVQLLVRQSASCRREIRRISFRCDAISRR